MHAMPGPRRVVSNFIVQALRGDEITLYGDGGQTRSLCYVDDLVDALLLFMATDHDQTGPLNLGHPVSTTIRELAERIVDLTGSASRLVTRPLPADDPRQRRPDVTRARAVHGSEPRTALLEGLVRTIAYFEALLTGTSRDASRPGC